MNRPRICASIVDSDVITIKEIEPLVDSFELRIDLVGESWPEVARELSKPWIACNRPIDEGGGWQEDEASRIDEVLKAIELGAEIVDIELRTKNLGKLVKLIKQRAKCLISSHDLVQTPPIEVLKGIIEKQLAAGADICKTVTTARSFEDNRKVLQLVTAFPKENIVSFAMGSLGSVSRVLSPLVGGYFTYASIEEGKESALGQITVKELWQLYKMVMQ